MKVTIEVIRHEDQRYPTVGDWIWNGDDLTIYVSDMGDWRYNMLVAFHELAECLICKYKGIEQATVDKFDIQYEELRMKGDVSEPGDSLMAPYYSEHQFATCVERLLSRELGVEWNKYDEVVSGL